MKNMASMFVAKEVSFIHCSACKLCLGEYESLVVDCPLYKKRIEMWVSTLSSTKHLRDEVKKFSSADEVGYIRIVKFHLVDKQ